MTHEPRKTKKPRWPQALVGFLVIQAIAAALYLAVEHDRARDKDRGQAVDDNLAFEPMSLPLQTLTLERPSETLTLRNSDEPLLLHIWATWCKPCREELPTLLALDDKIPLVAASTDETWPVIRHYFDDDVPKSVWRLQDKSPLPLRTLPTTFVIRNGRIKARLEGARRWSNEATRALLQDLEAP